MKPTYCEKIVLDYFFRGIRSTLRPELSKAFYLPQQLFSIKKVFSQPLIGSRDIFLPYKYGHIYKGEIIAAPY